MIKETFDDPIKKIDELIRKREQKNNIYVPKSETMQKIYDNIKFTEKVKNDPIMKKHEYKGFVSEEAKFYVINLNNFLNLRLYPRSVYVTDKLLRLVASSRLEWLKKYIAKKRSMPMNFLWVILLIFGIAIVIVMILLFLPNVLG